MWPTDRPTDGWKDKAGWRVACTQLYSLQPPLSVHPSIRRLVRRSVRRLVTFYFFYDFILWPHCSCPNGLVTSNMAPAHPHATWVAVCPTLFFCSLVLKCYTGPLISATLCGRRSIGCWGGFWTPRGCISHPSKAQNSPKIVEMSNILFLCVCFVEVEWYTHCFMPSNVGKKYIWIVKDWDPISSCLILKVFQELKITQNWQIWV